MRSIDDLLSEAKRLPRDQRLTLAHRLLESDEPAASAEAERAWDLEIRERIERFDRGKTTTRSASQVMDEADRILES